MKSIIILVLVFAVCVLAGGMNNNAGGNGNGNGMNQKIEICHNQCLDSTPPSSCLASGGLPVYKKLKVAAQAANGHLNQKNGPGGLYDAHCDSVQSGVDAAKRYKDYQITSGQACPPGDQVALDSFSALMDCTNYVA